MSTFRDREEAIWKAKGTRALEEYMLWPKGNARSKWLSERLAELEFKSIYEVGVFGGRNLQHIHSNFPDVILGGLDINELGIKYAREKLPHGQFDCISAFDIDTINGSWDIILTVGVAIHLAPDIFKEFIRKTINKANKYIIHMEKSGIGTIINGPVELNPKSKITDKIRWNPNFSEIYKEFGFNALITKLPTRLKSEDCANFIIVDLNKSEVIGV